MKKITFKMIAIFVAILSYQSYAQVSAIVEDTKYNLINFGTGDYLKANGTGAYEFFTVTASNPLPTDDVTLNFFFNHHNTTDPSDNTVHNYTDDWNIGNDVRGIMRASNTGTVHTNFKYNIWNSNGGHKTDKRWIAETIDQGGVTLFRFRSVVSGDTEPRYLYQGIDGVLYNITEADMNDAGNANTDGTGRSTWGVFESSIVLSTENFDASSIVIANPVKNQLSIQGLNDDISQLTVYNILGSRVLSKNIKGESSINLNVSNLGAGLYIVKLEGVKGAFTKKIIKE